MEAALKEISLLKGYVGTLQKENQARNIEKNTLFHEIDRLTAENDRLNDLLLKSNSRVIVGSSITNDKQLKSLKQSNLYLSKEIEGLNNKLAKLNADLRNKQNDITALNQDYQRWIGEIAHLQQVQNQLNAANSKIIVLENQINIYKIKSNGISTLQQNIKTLTIKNAELQQYRRFQSEFKRVDADYKRIQIELKRIEGQNRDLRFNNKSISDKQISDLRNTINKLNSDLKIKESQATRFGQQQQKLLNQLKSLRQIQNQSNNMRNKMVLVENQLNNYKIKASHNLSLEQSISTLTKRNIQLENNSKVFQSDYKRIDSDFKRLELQLKRLQAQNRDVKLNSKSSAQFSNMMNSKLSLQATIRQLNGKIQRLEANARGFDQQKISLQYRLKDLEKQLLQTKGKLTQAKFYEQSYKNVESSIFIKQKEMQALEQMIGSLKENKKYLEKIIKEKEQIIANLQSQVYNLKSAQYDSQSHQKQLTELKNSKMELEKRISLLTKNNQELQFELSKFSQKQRNFVLQINQLRSQRQRLLRQRDIQNSILQQIQRQINYLKNKSQYPIVPINKAYSPEKDRTTQNGQQLKMIVSKLRDEVEQLKVSQFKSNISNKEVHHQSGSNIHIKNVHVAKNCSPVSGIHSKLLLSNERDRNSFNKNKWQNLQKKINALRNQNDYLKKSLFD